MDKSLITSAIRTVFLAGVAIESALHGGNAVQTAEACTTCQWNFSGGSPNHLVSVSCIPGNIQEGCETDGISECRFLGGSCQGS